MYANAATESVNYISSLDNKSVSIGITGSEYRALIDTGSDVNSMRNDIYEKIGKPELSDTTLYGTKECLNEADGYL